MAVCASVCVRDSVRVCVSVRSAPVPPHVGAEPVALPAGAQRCDGAGGTPGELSLASRSWFKGIERILWKSNAVYLLCGRWEDFMAFP